MRGAQVVLGVMGLFLASLTAAAEIPAGPLANHALIYGTAEALKALPPPSGPVHLGPGAHLFLDNYLIKSEQGISRVVQPPRRDPRIPNPVVTAADDRCFQPFFTVSRSPETGRFRIWYGRSRDDRSTNRSQIGYLESADGIHWQRPAIVVPEPGELQFGSEVLDRGPQFADPTRRYVYCWWFGGGTRLAFSPDGFKFTPASPHVVLAHDHDISNVWHDPLHNRYVATLSSFRDLPQFKGRRRTTLMATSADLGRWTQPWIVLAADDRLDKDILQFYAMAGYLARGRLLVGLVKNLHDDWKAEGCPRGAFGIGSTSLAWSRDGIHWIRDREVFLPPDPRPGAWDHAHAWGDEQVLVGDEVYLYYGGYKWGHKHNRFEERQIGLVRFPRDRYVARQAGATTGRLRTVPLVLAGSGITVNSRVGGEFRARLVDENGQSLPGFEWKSVSGDAVAHPLTFAGNLASLGNRTVRIEFELRDAQLFGFDLLP